MVGTMSMQWCHCDRSSPFAEMPFGQWATQHAALRRLAEDSLASLAHRGIVRPGFVRTLVGERLAEAPGYYGEMVWVLMMLEQWLQAHAPDYCIDA